MERMIGFCGIICTECPAFLATQKDDDEERKRVALMWSQQYQMDIPSEHINCDGCLSESERLFCHTRVCPVRKCGQEKNLKNCAYCEEYACENLTKFFEMVSEAKTTLEEIRSSRLT